MKKRYRILKRVSVILILLALFTKMYAQKVPTNNIPKVEISVERLLIASVICFFILYPLPVEILKKISFAKLHDYFEFPHKWIKM